jgi:hypothetical protein
LPINSLLNELISQGLIIVYIVDNREYYHIRNFDKHQTINRPSPSKYPPFTDDSVTTHGVLTVGREGKGGEGKGKEGKVKDTRACADQFEIFYNAYPKKRSKGQAEKAWNKINPSEQLLATMLAKIERAKTSEDWQKDNGRFIPHPATWLNAKGWEDEISTPKSKREERLEVLRNA